MTISGVNARELILEILLQIEEEGEHSHIAIRNALSKYQFLPKKERAFIIPKEAFGDRFVPVMQMVVQHIGLNNVRLTQ